MKSVIYNSLTEKKKQGKKSFAVLIDPDKVSPVSLSRKLISKYANDSIHYPGLFTNPES
jgi:hypothetical protein